MEPTFHDGQRVWAFKTGVGARIYTGYDFSSPELHSFRMPGLRKLRRGDVAVFNYPYAYGPEGISFRINYVLIKRCAGVPGDTVCLDGFGPLFVPGKGSTVRIDSSSVRHYLRQIEFESGSEVRVAEDGTVTLGGDPIEEYSFSSDWYFFIGDNYAHSNDSRHFGLVPGSYIVGRVRQGSANLLAVHSSNYQKSGI